MNVLFKIIAGILECNFFFFFLYSLYYYPIFNVLASLHNILFDDVSKINNDTRKFPPIPRVIRPNSDEPISNCKKKKYINDTIY